METDFGFLSEVSSLLQTKTLLLLLLDRALRQPLDRLGKKGMEEDDLVLGCSCLGQSPCRAPGKHYLIETAQEP